MIPDYMYTRLAGSLVISALAFACRVPETPLPEPVRVTIDIPAGRELESFAISPDGSRIAYAAEENGRDDLFVTSLAASGVDTSFSDSAGASRPFFSPDGQAIAFFANRRLYRVRADGSEPPQQICEAPSGSAGGAWTDDGRILFAPLDGQGLLEVPASGGRPRPLTRLDRRAGEIAHGWPHALPGGGIVFTVSRRERDPQLAVLPPNGGEPRPLLPAVGQAHFVPSGLPAEAPQAVTGAKAGHLVYGYLGDLLAVPFDLSELATRGGPTIIARNLQSFRGFGDIGRTALSVSRNGTLAWLRGNVEEPRSLLSWVDRAGRLSPLTELAGQYQSPRLSSDGRRIAVVVRSGLMTRDIRVIDAARPDRVLLTLRGGDNHSPVWRPDGRRLTFASNRDGPQDIFESSLDGRVEKLIPTDGSARNPTSWSRRTPVLAFYRIMPDGGRDIQTFQPLKTLNILVATAANERSAALSEDGRWLAYVSDESGRDEVYVRRTDDPEGRGVQLSVSGGVEPLWTKDGLLYRDGAAVILTPFGAAALREPRGRPEPGRRTEGTLLEARLLFERRFELDPGGNLPDYDVSRDGQRLLMLKSARHPREIRVVKNWSTELARTVPLTRRKPS